jgi:hypothetical protein
MNWKKIKESFCIQQTRFFKWKLSFVKFFFLLSSFKKDIEIDLLFISKLILYINIDKCNLFFCDMFCDDF